MIISSMKQNLFYAIFSFFLFFSLIYTIVMIKIDAVLLTKLFLSLLRKNLKGRKKKVSEREEESKTRVFKGVFNESFNFV